MADFSATSGEPIIEVDPKDQIFVTTPFGLSKTLSLLRPAPPGGVPRVSYNPPLNTTAVEVVGR